MALTKLDPDAKLARLQLTDYFYHREHLFIVTNVLRDSLCVFYKHLAATRPSSGEHEHGDSPGVVALSWPPPQRLLSPTPLTVSCHAVPYDDTLPV